MDGNYFHSIVNYVHDHVNNLNLILIAENYLDNTITVTQFTWTWSIPRIKIQSIVTWLTFSSQTI